MCSADDLLYRMETVCDHCRIRGAMAYSEALTAWLCLQCDYAIRSGRERLETGSCFCQGCVWYGSCLRTSHQLQIPSPYPSCSSFFQSPFGSLPLNEGFSPVFGLDPSSIPFHDLDYTSKCRDRNVSSDSDNVDMSMNHAGTKVYETRAVGDTWEGVNMDDVESYFEDGDNTLELQELFTGPDSILTDPLIDEIIKFSATSSSSSSSSPSPPPPSQIFNSTVEDANPIEAHWELGFSQPNVSGETGKANVISPLPTTPLPLELNLEVGYDRRAREEAKKRYYAKREIRMYGKQIRYECRKTRADKRRRIRGRFVKDGEEYDYDPQIKKAERFA